MKAQVESLTKTLDETKKALEESTAKLESLTKELETTRGSLKAKEDAEKAEKVKTRRDALGDFAKDMTDEDILDDKNYEIATLKKALKEQNPEIATKLEIGTKDKTPDSDNKVWETQNKVQEKFRKTHKG